MHGNSLDPLRNRLLGALPKEDCELLLPNLIVRQIAQGTVIFEPNEPVHQAYFPISGAASLLVVMGDQKTVSVATIGSDGALGAMAALGAHVSKVRAIVHHPMSVSVIRANELQQAAAVSKPILEMIAQQNEALLRQASLVGACNALHHIENRFCRWLLQTHDRTESSTIALTQEFLSEMLGVRRTSITEAAIALQRCGAISYSRGVIKIIDLERLREFSCECYETMSFGT
jgi:CRP-like cAMP-binding protein